MAMMGKAVDLRVRPVRSADLSFPVSGIVARLPDTLLGSTVVAANLDPFYQKLTDTSPTDSSLLVWNSDTIRTTLSPQILSELRAEPIKADLDNAIAMRQNTFFTSYSDEVVTWARRVYVDYPGPSSELPWAANFALWHQLQELLLANYLHWGHINQEYLNDHIWLAFIKRPQSDTTYQSITTDPLGTEIRHNTASSQTVTGAGVTEYRLPSLENNMRFNRLGANVIQALMDAIRMREKCRMSNITFTNELATLDRQVKKLQVAYIDTMLLAPFSGLVTGVFCNEGDFVAAGRPVIRLENDEFIYLVGSIKCRGLLRVNYKVSVRTVLFDAAGGLETKIDGVIASVRGHDSIDEQWNVLVRCVNRTTAGDPIFPINYSFDFESTTVEVTPV